jgi:hypothetical protein
VGSDDNEEISAHRALAALDDEGIVEGKADDEGEEKDEEEEEEEEEVVQEDEGEKEEKGQEGRYDDEEAAEGKAGDEGEEEGGEEEPEQEDCRGEDVAVPTVHNNEELATDRRLMGRLVFGGRDNDGNGGDDDYDSDDDNDDDDADADSVGAGWNTSLEADEARKLAKVAEDDHAGGIGRFYGPPATAPVGGGGGLEGHLSRVGAGNLTGDFGLHALDRGDVLCRETADPDEVLGTAGPAGAFRPLVYARDIKARLVSEGLRCTGEDWDPFGRWAQRAARASTAWKKLTPEARDVALAASTGAALEDHARGVVAGTMHDQRRELPQVIVGEVLWQAARQSKQRFSARISIPGLGSRRQAAASNATPNHHVLHLPRGVVPPGWLWDIRGGCWSNILPEQMFPAARTAQAWKEARAGSTSTKDYDESEEGYVEEMQGYLDYAFGLNDLSDCVIWQRVKGRHSERWRQVFSTGDLVSFQQPNSEGVIKTYAGELGLPDEASGSKFHVHQSFFLSICCSQACSPVY